MTLRVYNTMSGRKEEFRPLNPPKVGMYACGVTVYDFCHIGHARAAVAFDVIARYLRYAGFDLTYVRNYTDVDDKIINRSNEQGIPWEELARTFIEAHDVDMAALGVQRADLEPRATDYIGQIIETVEALVANGIAYELEGDVYFEVAKFREYGKLSKRNIDELQAGARIDVDDRKRSPLDFALWKASKPGEPSWDSPWGKGRPGWHIECSAMSADILGQPFDIHGGGKDLIFPHHENEIAQSEGAFKKEFVRYWLHNGFVNIDNEKMSKSLGNFFTIREILAKYRADVVRFFLLSTHYRSPLDFSDKALEEAGVRFDRFMNLFARADRVGTEERQMDEVEGNSVDFINNETKSAFCCAMDDDFNTAAAIGHLFPALGVLNAVLDGADSRKSGVSRQWKEEVEKFFRSVGRVLGFFEEGFSGARTWFSGSGDEETFEKARAMAEERVQARKNKDYAKADELRKAVGDLGYEVQDTPQGPVLVPKK